MAFLKIIMMDEPLSGLKKGQFIESRDAFLGTILSWGFCNL